MNMQICITGHSVVNSYSITYKFNTNMKTSKNTPLEMTVNYWNQEYKVMIVKNKSIKIDCVYKNRRTPAPTSVTLEVGDLAEYDSYNLSYTGRIVSITEKTVSIVETCGNYKHIHRLKLADFCNRNWDFDAERIARSNSETLQYI